MILFITDTIIISIAILIAVSYNVIITDYEQQSKWLWFFVQVFNL